MNLLWPKNKRGNPPREGLVHGAVRDDGYRFSGVVKVDGKHYEQWISNEKYEARIAKSKVANRVRMREKLRNDESFRQRAHARLKEWRSRPESKVIMRDQRREWQRKAYQSTEYRERQNAYKRQWSKSPKQQERARINRRRWMAKIRKTDPVKVKRYDCQRILYAALAGAYTSSRFTALVGCNVADLRLHLATKFQPGMTWENYGHGWHVDHIVPCSAFDFSDDQKVLECFHFSNLQPLWKHDNLRKANKLTWTS